MEGAESAKGQRPKMVWRVQVARVPAGLKIELERKSHHSVIGTITICYYLLLR